MRNARA